MDIPVKFVLRGVGLGLRGTYRGLRMVHWKDTDRRDPIAPNIAARNIHRDRIRRQWGGMWERPWLGLPAVAPRPLAQRLRDGEDFRIMDGNSLQHLREYDQYAVENGIYKPANDLILQIRAAGPVGLYANIYARITSNDADTRIAAEKKIISLFANMWHRAKQMDWFREKIDVQYKVVKKVENLDMWKWLMDLQNKILHNLNDRTMKDIFEKLLKLLGAVV